MAGLETMEAEAAAAEQRVRPGGELPTSPRAGATPEFEEEVLRVFLLPCTKSAMIGQCLMIPL